MKNKINYSDYSNYSHRELITEIAFNTRLLSETPRIYFIIRKRLNKHIDELKYIAAIKRRQLSIGHRLNSLFNL